MTLQKIQAQFKELMLDHPDALDSPAADFAALFEAGDIALPERLKVYRHNIVNSLTDSLKAKLPVMEKLVGDEFLSLMARSFVLDNPPDHGCLNTYGQGFAAFIDGFELAKSMPYLPDVARLELALNAAYYAPDQEALSAEDLAAIPPEELDSLALPLCGYVNLLRSKWPLLAIKEFCEAEDPEGKLNLDQGGVQLMITRPALETKIVSLSAAEYELLQKLADGAVLGPAVESVLENHADFNFQDFLQKHIALETFVGFGANEK